MQRSCAAIDLHQRDFLSKFKTKFPYVVTTRGESSSVACIRSVSSIRISKRDVYSDRYYREKDGDREREKRRDLLCKKFWCAPPSVSLRFLSALLIFDYHPLMRHFWVKDHLLLLLSPPSETLKSWSRSLREKFWISVGPFNQVWKQVFVPKRATHRLSVDQIRIDFSN